MADHQNNTPFGCFISKWPVLLIRTDLLPASGININQVDAGHCLCTKHSRLLPLKVSCSLILSLSLPDHVCPVLCGWSMWSLVNHINLTQPTVVSTLAMISYRILLWLNKKIRNIIRNEKIHTMQIGSRCKCAAHLVWLCTISRQAVGCIPLCSCICMTRRCSCRFGCMRHIWHIHHDLMEEKRKRVICNKLGVLKRDPNT